MSDKAFEQALESSLSAWAGKQRPAFRNRVELLDRAAEQQFSPALLAELRQFSNGKSISHPGLFSLLYGHQSRLLNILMNF
jgi:hypothetical protein